LGVELARNGVLRHIVQEVIDSVQYLLGRLPQLPSRSTTRDAQRLRRPTLEPEVHPDLLVLEQCDVLQQEPYQAFAVPRRGLVVYSRVADNVPRLPPSRLRGVLQPIMRTLSRLSTSHPSLGACL
jgi:hypothetical protein